MRESTRLRRKIDELTSLLALVEPEEKDDINARIQDLTTDLRALTHEYAKHAPTGYQPPRKEEK